MLSRTLFEAAIDAYWVAENPAEAERLARAPVQATAMLTAERWNENGRMPRPIMARLPGR
jgi:hypothetical protein